MQPQVYSELFCFGIESSLGNISYNYNDQFSIPMDKIERPVALICIF